MGDGRIALFIVTIELHPRVPIAASRLRKAQAIKWVCTVLNNVCGCLVCEERFSLLYTPLFLVHIQIYMILSYNL